MLLSGFYSILEHTGPEKETQANGSVQSRYHFSVALDPSHAVYRGHFPGNPVVPGVCQIQMIQELIGGIQGVPVKLENADTIKFLSLIVPGQVRLLEFDIAIRDAEAGKVPVNVTIHEGATIFLKFKGIFSRL
jgi:3-hydroxyacyl-[acyl-carrier-protein] dehydratase